MKLNWQGGSKRFIRSHCTLWLFQCVRGFSLQVSSWWAISPLSRKDEFRTETFHVGFTDQLDGPPTPRNFPCGFYGSARRPPHTPNPIPTVGVSDRVSFLCGPLLAAPFGKPLMAFLPFGSVFHGHVQVESALCGRTYAEPKRKVTPSCGWRFPGRKHSKCICENIPSGFYGSARRPPHT